MNLLNNRLDLPARGMFRRMYRQIVAILAVSMLILLMLVGSLVYVELKVQMEKDGEVDLQTDISELQALISWLTPNPSWTFPVYSYLPDDNGKRLYFVVFEHGTVCIESYHPPIPSNCLPREVPADQERLAYRMFEYRGEPYQVVATAWNHAGRMYKLYLYQSIVSEQQVLHHALWLLMLSGSTGAVLAILFYLWLGRRILRPASESWQTQQWMLVELTHELQTPLATINAVVESQVRDADRGRLVREIRRASELISDILYLFRLESMPVEEREPVAVSDLTEEVADHIGWLAERQGITLSGSAVQGLYVLCTPDEWRRLVSTLLKNVVDYGRPSQASWRLTVDERCVLLVVENELDKRDCVAEPGRTHGFGLDIVRRLTQSMGGNFMMETNGHTVRAQVRVPRL
ncbi:sensor histidine kinase [Alicyclobacillus kakegawensis]|uniref:sensor histidine kinase n=1 Tax=Alicyclobacillus kakegawensis TaxID=392012 RepID=UPI00082A5D79|nr:HAMP domain-containing sensor histidine kinase [Alicyclobacillus kakegawensis]